MLHCSPLQTAICPCTECHGCIHPADTERSAGAALTCVITEACKACFEDVFCDQAAEEAAAAEKAEQVAKAKRAELEQKREARLAETARRQRQQEEQVPAGLACIWLSLQGSADLPALLQSKFQL